MPRELLPDDVTLPSLALREADTHRAVRAYAGAAIISAIGFVGLRLVDGPRWPRLALTIASAATALTCGWLAWSRRREGVYSEAEASAVAMLLCITALCGVAFVGPLTAPAAMLVMLVVGLSMAKNRTARHALIVTIGYCVLGVLALLGVIEPISEVLYVERTASIVSGLVLVEAVLIAAYVFGRSARHSTEAALGHVQRARLVIEDRQALLDEAFADLERLGGGGRGRLSGGQLGTFRLEEVLGRGGMGEVYRAKDLDSGRNVAIKVLQPNLVSEAAPVERFFREAKISSGLDSPHIVAVLDHGLAGDGSPYLVMELLDGRTLTELLRSDGPLDMAAAETLVSHAAAGLAVAHAAGIVHRDVKPQNLMLTKKGGWKLLDFGISKLLAGAGTLTRDPVGTPGYMAPEQALGQEVDHRADVFSLGAVAYRALTGRPPFGGRDAVAATILSIERQPLRPSALVAGIEEDVELVLALALAKRREDRFEQVRELGEAFVAARQGALSNKLRARGYELLSHAPWSAPERFALDTVPEGEEEAATVVATTEPDARRHSD